MQLLEEFFRQGDKERDLGLPFSPLCDRNNTLVAESQIGFIEFIVEPSMQVCSDMLETVLTPLNAKESVDETNNGERAYLYHALMRLRRETPLKRWIFHRREPRGQKV